MRLIDQGEHRLDYHPGFLPRDQADIFYKQLIKDISWRQNDIRMFGKEFPEPRFTAWFGPSYTYSTISWPAQPMPEWLKGLAERLAADSGFEFNAVLLNRYRNGSDGMGWHRDNEPEIDQRLIASLSLGATRKFSVKPKHGGEAVHVQLNHGDALWMRNLQQDWKHQLPKTRKAVGERINLTFRRIQD